MTKTGLEKLFEISKDKVSLIAEADNALDSKVGTLMAFEITIIIGYLSLNNLSLSACSITFAILGLLLMAGSVCLLFYVNWPKQYITASVNLNERKEYLSKTDDQLILQLISDAQNAFTKNNEILERKTICYKIAILLLIISTPLLILAII